jgi:hypothetical protein
MGVLNCHAVTFLLLPLDHKLMASLKK